MCDESCYTASPDDSGNFSFSGLEPRDYTFQAVALGDSTYAVPNALIPLAASESRDLSEPVVVPAFATDHIELSRAGQAVLVDGLELVGDPGTMEVGTYTPDYNEDFTGPLPYVAGVRMDPASAGLPLDGVPGTIVAMWYLGNFDVQLTSPWPFTTTFDSGLAEGTELEIYTLVNTEHAWVSGGVATVGPGGTIQSEPGAGVAALGSVVIVQP
jgi:hypothetical protein